MDCPFNDEERIHLAKMFRRTSCPDYPEDCTTCPGCESEEIAPPEDLFLDVPNNKGYELQGSNSEDVDNMFQCLASLPTLPNMEEEVK